MEVIGYKSPLLAPETLEKYSFIPKCRPNVQTGQNFGEGVNRGA